MPDMNQHKPQRVKVRKNSLTEDLYLDRQGRWVPWREAAWFRSDQAAEQFAQKHGIAVFGLFPCESCISPQHLRCSRPKGQTRKPRRPWTSITTPG
jgi:hypothetical protein